MRFLLALCLLLLAGSPGLAGERVTVASLDGVTGLPGFLWLPAGPPPYPGIVFLHGCSGLGRKGRVFGTYTAWARHMTAAGYAVLMIDSMSPRGFDGTCGQSDRRRVMYAVRPKDAYGALRYLQALPFIRADRIALMGWSQGGATALLSIEDRSLGRPRPPLAHDFRAAIAFYPGACSERLQSKPFTTVPVGAWSTAIPLLVLHGEADNWTPAVPCQSFVEGLRARGLPVRMRLFPGAYHSFDAPGMKLHARQDITTARGEHPIIGTDEAARQAVLELVPAFLRETMPVD